MGRRTIGMPFARPGRAAAVALVGALVGAGALAGCDSEATPSATSSPSVTATGTGTGGSPSPSGTSPSPSVSATVEVPAAAREKTEKGAEAFVRFFFDQVNEAWTKPASGLVAAQSDSGCQFCLKTESDAEELVNAVQRYASDPIELTTVSVVAGAAPEGQSFVRTDALQNHVDVVDARNSVVRSDTKKDLRLMTGLIWKGGRWYVYEVEER